MQIKKHTLRKLDTLRAYLNAYSTATTKAYHTYYVDGFSGVGLCKPPGRAPVEDGSAMLALKVPRPFTAYHFVDLSPDSIRGLQANIGLMLPQAPSGVTFHVGDSNEIVPGVVAGFEKRSPSLVFLDPFGMELHFDTLRELARHPKAELLILFYTSGLFRNLPLGSAQPLMNPQNITKFYGNDKWHDFYEATGKTSSKWQFRHNIIQGYLQNLKDIGYTYQFTRQIEVHSKRVPLYVLIWAAHKDNDKGELGLRIMRGVGRTDREGQRTLF